MCRFWIPLLLALALAGQDKPQDTAGKPDPVKKARELLDAAAEMLGGTQPQIQVVGLWHLAENYHLFDRKKALEFYKQAFAACSTLPPEQIDRYQYSLQAEIAQSVTDVDLDLAMEMTRQIPGPKAAGAYDLRSIPIIGIINSLSAKSDFDRAIAFLDAMGGLGIYSFNAADIVFGSLPADDPRRQSLFGAANAAFDLHPNEEFKWLLANHAKDVPPNMASAALRSLLRFVLDKKPEGDSAPYQATGISTTKGTVVFNTPVERTLFDVMWVVREVEPKRADEIFQKYPELKASLEAFPKGMQSLKGDGQGYTFVVTSDQKNMTAQQMTERFRMRFIMESRKTEALNTLLNDPDKALEVARTIPTPTQQTAVLSAVARSVGDKDPAKGRNLLNKCMDAIKEVKDPGERIESWDAIAEAADVIHDEKLFQQALDRGLADAAELYKWDEEDAKDNVRLQEYWPSTTAYRRIVMRATQILKTDAEPLLLKIADPNLNLLARIAMAQELLGKHPKMWPVYRPRRRPRQ